MTVESPVRRSPIRPCDCNLTKAVTILRDRWTLMILRSALHGVCRFDDFQAELDIPRSVLSNRLTALVECGVMEQRDYRETGQRARIEYPLSAMGRALGLPFMAMTEWGDRWLAGSEPPPVTLKSRISGQRLRVAFVDESGQAVQPRDVEIVIASRMTPESLAFGLSDAE